MIQKKLVRCLWVKGCTKMCLVNVKCALSKRLCHTHRQEAARAKIRKSPPKPFNGPCIRCGRSTVQKNEKGEWHHRAHTVHLEITKQFALEEQRALETIAGDTTSLGERARFLERMGKDANFTTHGGESFYGPILTWRKQG